MSDMSTWWPRGTYTGLVPVSQRQWYFSEYQFLFCFACNSVVLRSVSRNDLIHTVHDRQLCFLGHMLQNAHSSHASTCALYQPTHGTTRRNRPRLNYVDYIEKLTGMKVNELLEVSQDREAGHELVVTCVDLQLPD